jgi:hypothetical protein
MRIRVTNASQLDGHFLVTYGDGDEDRPPKLRTLAPGAAKELAITQKGYVSVLDFKADIVSVPKRMPKPENPSQTKRAGRSTK